MLYARAGAGLMGNRLALQRRNALGLNVHLLAGETDAAAAIYVSLRARWDHHITTLATRSTPLEAAPD